MRWNRIQKKFDRTLLRVIQQNGGIVTLVWDAAPAPGAVFDEATYQPQSLHSEDAPAIIHYVSATTVQKQGLGFQAGDAIITFHPRTALGGRRNLRFILRSRVRLEQCAITSGSAAVTCASTEELNVGSIITGLHVPAGTTVMASTPSKRNKK